MRKWRAKQYVLRLGQRRRLLLTARRFHTAPSRRSRRYRQLIIPIDAWGIAEIAVRLAAGHRRNRRPSAQAASAFWRLHVSLPVVLLALGGSGSGYFGTQLVAAHSLEPSRVFSSSSAPASLASKALPYSIPTHLSIPSVNIDADITPVGLDAAGHLEMPPLFAWEAGWYKYSPAPGQVGPAIIAGHVDTYKGVSVFWRLRDVHRGDVIHITRADGRTATFKITTLMQYGQDDFPTAKVYGNISYPGLRLITCGGTFDEATGHYTENTVVSAFLVTT